MSSDSHASAQPFGDTLMRLPAVRAAMLGGWALLALLCLLLWTAALPVRFAELQTAGGTAAYQLAPQELALLTEGRVTANVYAAFILTFEVLQTLMFVAVALVLFWRRRGDFMALFTSQTLLVAGTIAPAITAALTHAGQWTEPLNVAQCFRYALTLIFFYTFPDGRFFPAWSRWGVLLALPLIAGIVLWGGDPGQWSPLTQAAAVLAWMLPPLLAQGVRWRARYTPEQRQQVKWILLGMGILLATSLLRYLLMALFPALVTPGAARLLFHAAFAVPILDTLVFWLIPLSIGASILRYRLYGIDLAINRSLVFGGVTLALMIVFASGLFLIQGVLRLALGVEDATLALVVSTAATFALFNPVRARVQHLVDHHLFRLRLDLNQINRRQLTGIPVPPSAAGGKQGVFSGQALAGCTLGDLLGKGGMGEVYRAVQSGLARTVAVKILSETLTYDPEARARFEREARTVAALNHPNIVRVYDFGVVAHEGSDQPYMVMEYVEGQTLSERLRDGALPPETAYRVVADVAAALDYAHTQSVVHRDVKPANVMLRMVTGGERAVLMDFGIAKLFGTVSGLTATGMMGTLDYAAPEQILNAQAVDARADLYALGVMTFQMLTGRLPFSGGVGEVVFAHLQQPAPDPRDFKPDLPAAAALAVLRALAKAPEDRFETANEFLQAMR